MGPPPQGLNYVFTAPLIVRLKAEAHNGVDTTNLPMQRQFPGY
jgi:hypothetical protein